MYIYSNKYVNNLLGERPFFVWYFVYFGGFLGKFCLSVGVSFYLSSPLGPRQNDDFLLEYYPARVTMVTLLDHRAHWSHGVARRSSREQLRFSLSHLTNIILRISMTGRKYQFITLSVSHLTQADITQGFIVSSFISIYFWLQNNNKQSRQHPGQGPSQVFWTEMEKVLWIVINKNVRSWSTLVNKLLWLN